MDQVIAWFVAFMVAQSPLGSHHWIPEDTETAEQTQLRYTSIASDFAKVVYDEDEAPIFKGSDGRARTLSVLGAVARFESGGFRRDIDYGVGDKARGDGGESWCLLQVRVGPDGRTPKWNQSKHRYAYTGDNPADLEEGWTGPELVQDRTKCIRSGLRRARESALACRSNNLEEILNLYASGKCDEGSEASSHRMNLAIKWYKAHRPVWKDGDIMALLYPELATN